MTSIIIIIVAISLTVAPSQQNLILFVQGDRSAWIILFTVLTLVGIFPISYLAYLLHGQPAQLERFRNDLKLLGLVTEEELDNVNQLYSTVYNPFQFLGFILLLMAISAVMFSAYYISRVDPVSLEKLIRPEIIEIIFFAFLGAYFFGVRLVIRRYSTFDLQPQVYASIILRILLSVVITFGITSLRDLYSPPKNRRDVILPDLAASAGQNRAASPSPSASSARSPAPEPPQSDRTTADDSNSSELVPWQILAFLIGVFPDQALRFLATAVSRALKDPTLYQYNERPLRKIAGINVWHEARFEELGIDDVQSLATADICRLLLTSQFDTMQIINWIDQAILHMKAGNKIDQFLALQISTYHELITILRKIESTQPKPETTSNQTETNGAAPDRHEEDHYRTLAALLQDLVLHLKQSANQASKQNEYDKLIVALGFLSLAELDRLCDYSNYPNYVRIQEYYKNIDSVAREQARRGTREIIGSSDVIGGELSTDIQEEAATKPLISPSQKDLIESEIERLNREAENDPQDTELLLKLGIRYYQLGKFEAALAVYQQALDANPAQPSTLSSIYTSRSLICIMQGNRERLKGDSRAQEERTRPEEQNSAAAASPAAGDANLQQNHRSAQTTAQSAGQPSTQAVAPQADPREKALLHYQKAQEFYQKAIRDNKNAISINPLNAIAFNNLALAYMRQSNLSNRPLSLSLSDLGSALECLDEALRLNDRYPTAYYNRGVVRNTLGGAGYFADATADLERAHLLGFRTAGLWAVWGLALLNLGKYQEAIEKFTQAIFLAPDEPAAFYCHRGLAYIKRGEQEGQKQEREILPEYAQRARFDLNRAIEKSSDMSAAYANYGLLNLLEGNYSEAIKSYEKAIELDEENRQTDIDLAKASNYANLAQAYFRQAQNSGETDVAIQHYECAIEKYRDAIENGERRLQTRFNLGVAYGEAGKITGEVNYVIKAKDILNKILQETHSSQKSDDNVDAELIRSYLDSLDSALPPGGSSR